MLRRASVQALRHLRPKGGHGWPGGSFWSEGTQTGRNGYLFGESPPPPGQGRKWETWEFPTYTAFGIAALMAWFITHGPDNSLQAWARPVAVKELEEEDEIFKAFADSKALQAEKAAALRAVGKHPDRYYDAVMMRNEFDVLQAKHAAANS